MKKFFKVFGIVIGIVVVAAGIYAYMIFDAASDLLDEIYTPVDTEDVREVPIVLGDDPISILILGIDREEYETGGRSDSMMLVTINPNENSTNILSIARDTLVTISGRGTQERINHAFAWGGATMAIETVQDFLQIPIDFFIELDMNGFGALIDAVGGVTVDNAFAFSQHGIHFPVGEQRLNGDEALAFVRMRDIDGDFGRQGRQRMIIESLAREMVGSGLTRFQQIFDAAEGYMATNISMNIVTNILWNYSGAIRDINQFDMPGVSSTINGMYVQIIPEGQLLEMQSRLQQHLEVE